MMFFSNTLGIRLTCNYLLFKDDAEIKSNIDYPAEVAKFL